MIRKGLRSRGIVVDQVGKGGSVGAVMKSLELKWSVSLVCLPSKAKLKERAYRLGGRVLVAAGVSNVLIGVRKYGAEQPGYFRLSRVVASAVARFRFGYGPDRVSLAKRRLCNVVCCRWCGGGREDVGHLLLECVELGFVSFPLWRFSSVAKVFGDGVSRKHWHVVGKVLEEVYVACCEWGN